MQLFKDMKPRNISEANIKSHCYHSDVRS